MHEWVRNYCHVILNFKISALVSFSVFMVQSSDRSNLREEGFISRFSTLQQQKLKEPGKTTSTIKTQQGKEAKEIVSFYGIWDPQPGEWPLSMVVQDGFPT